MNTIDCAIAIIFNDKNQVLLTERHDPDHPQAHKKWQFPGGGVEEGETPQEATLREIIEETGLIIELVSQDAFRFDHSWDNGESVVRLFGFPAKHVAGDLDISKEEETSDAKWFNYEEIPFDNVLPFTKELIDQSIQYLKDLSA